MDVHQSAACQSEVFLSLEGFRQWRKAQQGKTVAFVPTMGALHEGHLALVRMAQSLADVVVVSIFVNPLQFRPSEDFTQYPRPVEADLAKCQALGVAAVLMPTVEEMYPNGREAVTTVVPPEAMVNQLCGLSRPGHFNGVATVVLKLFAIVQPDVAVFGEKDAQQLAIIRRMSKDLNLPVQVVAHPTVRNKKGLALSSRNQYLDTPAKQSAALILWQVLETTQSQVQALKHPVATREVLAHALASVLDQHALPEGVFELEYLEAVNAQTFASLAELGPDCPAAKVLVAAKLYGVRLIDNLDLTPLPYGARSAQETEQAPLSAVPMSSF